MASVGASAVRLREMRAEIRRVRQFFQPRELVQAQQVPRDLSASHSRGGLGRRADDAMGYHAAARIEEGSVSARPAWARAGINAIELNEAIHVVR